MTGFLEAEVSGTTRASQRKKPREDLRPRTAHFRWLVSPTEISRQRRPSRLCRLLYRSAMCMKTAIRLGDDAAATPRLAPAPPNPPMPRCCSATPSLGRPSSRPTPPRPLGGAGSKGAVGQLRGMGGGAGRREQDHGPCRGRGRQCRETGARCHRQVGIEHGCDGLAQISGRPERHRQRFESA